jgi:hypothetical protein
MRRYVSNAGKRAKKHNDKNTYFVWKTPASLPAKRPEARKYIFPLPIGNLGNPISQG